MTRVRASIAGLQRGQARNVRTMAALRPSGAFGEAIRSGTEMAHRAAVNDTAVDTGAWRASHRMTFDGLRGRVYLSPGARNPKSRQLVRIYAKVYEDRAGSYAVYKNTVRSSTAPIQREAARILSQAIR